MLQKDRSKVTQKSFRRILEFFLEFMEFVLLCELLEKEILAFAAKYHQMTMMFQK